MTFKQLIAKIQEKFESMQKSTLYLAQRSENQDKLWDLYLKNISEDPVFRNPDFTIHNGNCDRRFLQRYGFIVNIVDGKTDTMFNIDVEYPYVESFKKMHEFVSSLPIESLFIEDLDFLRAQNYESKDRKWEQSNKFQLGKPNDTVTFNEENSFGRVVPGKIYEFNHFNVQLNSQFAKKNAASVMSEHRTSYELLKRLLTEVSVDTIKLVGDLITQTSILNSEQYSGTILKVIKTYDEYKKSGYSNLYLWSKAEDFAVSRFRNTVLGTLCVDLTEGADINKACMEYNRRVDPANFMKAKAPITEGQKKEADRLIEEKGYKGSFDRRFATLADINVNEIKHIANNETKNVGLFSANIKSVSTRHKKAEFDGISKITIEKFMSEVLPTATGVEVFMENSLMNNLVALSTSNVESKNPFKWSNDFCWTYKSGLTGVSQIAQEVSNKGGNIDAPIRFSLMWNESGLDVSDLDAHAFFKGDGGNSHIYYANKHFRNNHLDVDIIRPRGIAVENIAINDANGYEIELLVNCFANRNSLGFKAEVKLFDQVFNYVYDKKLPEKSNVKVATINVKKDGSYTITHHLDHNEKDNIVWNIKTNQFHKVDLVCLSPNYWGDNNVGNKHYFFFINDCKCDEPLRLFHSEFLNNDLMSIRKSVDVLGNFLKVEPSDKHLAGLGFNSTVQSKVIVKVKGTHTRLFEVSI